MKTQTKTKLKQELPSHRQLGQQIQDTVGHLTADKFDSRQQGSRAKAVHPTDRSS